MRIEDERVLKEISTLQAPMEIAKEVANSINSLKVRDVVMEEIEAINAIEKSVIV